MIPPVHIKRLPRKMRDTHPPSKSPFTTTSYNPDSGSSNVIIVKSPHRSHSPKQGNPCPNYKSNSHPSPVDTIHSEKNHSTPPTPSSPHHKFKAYLKPPNTTLCKSPHGSHGLK